jgi:hypothetical protein
MMDAATKPPILTFFMVLDLSSPLIPSGARHTDAHYVYPQQRPEVKSILCGTDFVLHRSRRHSKLLHLSIPRGEPSQLGLIGGLITTRLGK